MGMWGPELDVSRLGPIGAYPPAWKPTGWKRPRWEESLKIKSLHEKKSGAVMGEVGNFVNLF